MNKLKNKLRAIVTIAMTLIVGFSANAHDFDSGGIFYNITSSSSKTVEVTYRGYSYDSYSNEYSGIVVIPETITYGGVEYSVTSIGDDAFADCSGLTSVTIGNSVTSIGDWAFADCSGLTSIEIPNSVTSIGYRAFQNCLGLKSVTIGNSVTSISDDAFYNCSRLTSVVVEEGNSVYDSRENCNAIIETETNKLISGCKNSFIPNSVTSIGDYAFSSCSGLTSIEIPNSVTSIGYRAFYNCYGLTSVTIGNSVTSIGDYAFSYCSGLTEITCFAKFPPVIYSDTFYGVNKNIPLNVENESKAVYETANYWKDFNNIFEDGMIGHTFTFDGLVYEITKKETEVAVIGFKNNIDLGDIVIPEYVLSFSQTKYKVTSIGNSAFYNCDGLTSVTIGNSVTSIGNEAFSDCSGLTSVVWNAIKCNDFTYNSGKSGPFYNNKNITSFTFGDAVQHIPAYLCYEMSKLTTIEIPNSVTSIGYSAFYGCTGLTNVYINDLEAYCNIEFGGDYGYAYAYANPVSYAKNLYLNGSLIEDLVIPEGVTKISDAKFYGLNHIKTVTIPNSVTSIGRSAFYGCSGLTSIEIPNSVTSIGEDAFYDCDGLTSIEIPNSVTSIGDDAFADCSGLTSVTIGNSVTSIGGDAFHSCSGLTSVVWNAINCTDVGWNPFSNCSNITSFTFGDAMQHIPASLCYDMSKLTSIEIPNSVTSIGHSAFYGCTGLTEITCFAKFPPVIYSSTFYNVNKNIPLNVVKECKAVYETANYWKDFNNIFEDGMIGHTFTFDGLVYEITKKETEVAVIGFKNNIDLGDIVIPEYVLSFSQTKYKVTSIGNSAFYGCSRLTSIEIPNSVTAIGNYAFQNCLGLTSVTIGNSVTSIGDWAFADCSGLTSIEIPNSVTSIGHSAFNGCTGLTSIEIPNSVTSIGNYAFSDCSGLTSVVWNAIKCNDFTYNSGESGPFYNNKNITSFTFGDAVQHIPAYLCYDMSKLTSIEIPNSVTSIGGEAFSGCSGLTSIEIPNSVNSIGNSAFSDCSGLTSVVWNAIKCNDFAYYSNRPFYNCSNITSFTFGDAVQHIPAYLCYEMSKLTTIEIPNSVNSIRNYAFNGCSKLTIITLGNSLLSIGEDAFKECNNIKKVESKATKAPIIENEDQFFSEVYQKADLFVPLGYEDNYKYAYGWSEFNNIVGKDFTIRATSIVLDKTEVTLKQSESVALTETILPYETSNKTVIWSTSDESVATVAANGLVTAISVGEATITATTADGSNLSATCKVIVLPQKTVGDATGDGEVNVTDVVAITNHILGSSSENFQADASDVNGDGEINVTDVVAVTNIILGVAQVNELPTEDSTTSSELTLTDNGINDNGIQTIDVALFNDRDFTAFQADLRLPAGMELVDVVLSDRASSSHSMNLSVQADGSYRMISYSMVNEAYADNNGTLFTLVLKSTNAASGELVIEDIIFTTPQAIGYNLDDVVMEVAGTTALSTLPTDTRIYAQDGYIVIESPADCIAVISGVDGVARQVAVNAGMNKFEAMKGKVYIVKTLNRTVKVMM